MTKLADKQINIYIDKVTGKALSKYCEKNKITISTFGRLAVIKELRRLENEQRT